MSETNETPDYTIPKSEDDFETFEAKKVYLLAIPQVHFFKVGELRKLRASTEQSHTIVSTLFSKLDNTKLVDWLRVSNQTRHLNK